MSKTNKANQPKELFTTGVGTFLFPYLVQPRDYQGNEKFNYDTKFLLEGADAEKLIAVIDRFMAKAADELKQRNRRPPYAPHTDKEGNEVEGVTCFTFKVPARIETYKGTWIRKPKLFDGNGHLIEGKISIGTGSKGRIKFSVYMGLGGGGSGVRLEPLAVMISELVEPGGYADSDVAFEADEAVGGFEYHGDDEPQPESFETQQASEI